MPLFRASNSDNDDKSSISVSIDGSFGPSSWQRSGGKRTFFLFTLLFLFSDSNYCLCVLDF